MTFYALILFFIPFFSVPYIVLQTVMSIWYGIIRYHKNENNYLKWDIQKIITTILTIFFSHTIANIIYDNSMVGFDHSLIFYLKEFYLHPCFLVIYLIFIQVIVLIRKQNLSNTTTNVSETVKLRLFVKNCHNLSLFIFAILSYSIWWIAFARLFIPLSQLGEGLGG